MRRGRRSSRSSPFSSLSKIQPLRGERGGGVNVKKNVYRKHLQGHIRSMLQHIISIILVILSKMLQLTLVQLTFILIYILAFLSSLKAVRVYFIDWPRWKYEKEWIEWEEMMQHSVADLIPPLPPSFSYTTSASHGAAHALLGGSGYNGVLSLETELRTEKLLYDDENSNDKNENQDKSASQFFAVPLPDYELMAEVRGELARKLHYHAVKSCNETHKLSSTFLAQKQQQQQKQYDQQRYSQEEDQHLLLHPQQYSFPVMGITVATDSPTTNYLRRLLHTTDLNVVGSIVITWYDERTEAQLSGRDRRHSLSHSVILHALEEFIVTKKFVEIPWNVSFSTTSSAQEQQQQQQQPRKVQMADVTSMKLMSKIATTVHQYCRYNDKNDNESSRRKRTERATKNGNLNLSSCRNELIIIRFSTNLGCSPGVNNPLFLHPHAPHWLIVNYDIAYPPGVLSAMGHELQATKWNKPDLAVHTFGYIYGRGKIENPWSNFAVTSCAVANVGVWDENIFPAYYEDDDFRDRIRYIMGEWVDVIGNSDGPDDGYRNVPYKWMNDTHLIRYQTDRSVAVVHGPLSATMYLSGTHEALKEKEEKPPLFRRILNWLFAGAKKEQQEEEKDPYYYESQRWNIYKGVSDSESYFRCKHGALPDPGEHGEDSLRYFGWHERFVEPFVNRTRLTKLQEKMTGGHELKSRDDVSLWSLWRFNATRRKCVHEATNALLAMPSSPREKAATIATLKEACTVC